MELDLQQFLAAQLPEKIFQNHPEGEFRWVRYSAPSIIGDNAIRETEWLAVCNMVEEKLTERQRMCYMRVLVVDAYMLDDKIMSNNGVWELMRSTWQQRAKALKGILG